MYSDSVTNKMNNNLFCKSQNGNIFTPGDGKGKTVDLIIICVGNNAWMSEAVNSPIKKWWCSMWKISIFLSDLERIESLRLNHIPV